MGLNAAAIWPAAYGVDSHRGHISAESLAFPVSLHRCGRAGQKEMVVWARLRPKWQQWECTVASAITSYHHPAVIAMMSMIIIAPLFLLLVLVLVLAWGTQF